VLILLVKGVTDASVIIGERKLWAGAVFSFFFICYLATNGLAIHESLWARDPMKRPPWRSLKWMEKNTDSDSGIFSLIAPSIALYTERYATSDFRASNVEEFKYYLLKRNIDYILDRRVVALTPAVGATENHNLTWIRIRRWINSRPDEFELVFRDPVEETSIYKITKKHEFIAAYKKYISAAHAYEARHFTDAFQSTLEALAMYPNLGSATNLLGVLYMRKNDLLRAEQLFLRTHELRPNSYRTLFNLSTLYHMNGQQDRSLAYIKKGLSVSRANGEEEWFFKNFKEFQNAWNQGTCMLFIDQPSVI
jgi:tetratricopeptide (TPR) repeat protein